MKKTFHITSTSFLFAVILIISSCAKDKQSQLDGITWQVTTITTADGLNPVSLPESVSITFGKDNSVTLKLDVNSCLSTYVCERSGKLSIKSFGCTKMCCDDPASETLKSLLSEVTDYSVIQGVAQLNAPNRIINLVKKTS